MKIFKNLVDAIALTLTDVYNNNRYADKALEKLFKQHPKWGSRDRRFVAEGVYDCVRYYRLYAELAQSPKNYWFITAVWLVLKEYELPTWNEFKHVNPQAIKQHFELLQTNLPIAQSYPDWLWDLASKEIGETNWQTEAIAMNKQAHVVIRANTLKIACKDLKTKLHESGIETEAVEGVANALQLVKRENIFRNELFLKGNFEVQDTGSQMISEFAEVKPTDYVIDACAGGGGKSLHLAAIMQNKGRVVSMDVEAWKLEELKKRAKRAGAFNIETRLISDAKIIKRLHKTADVVLLDVPCSGLGVIKRNPDAKWKLSLETIEKTKKLQTQILNGYSEMVKASGKLIYSTCSILPSENKNQVDKFLLENKEFKFIKDYSLLPSAGYDGFYMCMMERVID